MTNTMKGLLKGLRYISQIFEAEEEDEPEMQIGLPTDVKHVAHIGLDGPSSNNPSWMGGFTPNTEKASSKNEADVPPQRRHPSLDNSSVTTNEVQNQYNNTNHRSHDESKQSRRRHSTSESVNNNPQSPSASPSSRSDGVSSLIPKSRKKKSSTKGTSSKGRGRGDEDGSTVGGSRRSGDGSTRGTRSRSKGQQSSEIDIDEPRSSNSAI